MNARPSFGFWRTANPAISGGWRRCMDIWRGSCHWRDANARDVLASSRARFRCLAKTMEINNLDPGLRRGDEHQPSSPCRVIEGPRIHLVFWARVSQRGSHVVCGTRMLRRHANSFWVPAFAGTTTGVVATIWRFNKQPSCRRRPAPRTHPPRQYRARHKAGSSDGRVLFRKRAAHLPNSRTHRVRPGTNHREPKYGAHAPYACAPRARAYAAG